MDFETNNEGNVKYYNYEHWFVQTPQESLHSWASKNSLDIKREVDSTTLRQLLVKDNCFQPCHPMMIRSIRIILRTSNHRNNAILVR